MKHGHCASCIISLSQRGKEGMYTLFIYHNDTAVRD